MNNETQTTKLLPAHVPFYKTRKFWIGFQMLIYVIGSILISVDLFPLLLASILGLLIPGLFLVSFLPEIAASIIAGILLTLLTHTIDNKSRLLLIGFALIYYSITYYVTIQYIGI